MEFEEGVLWGAVNTRLLTGWGVLNGESESFGSFLWGRGRPMNTLFETEKSGSA
jgi:hypothetical protein